MKRFLCASLIAAFGLFAAPISYGAAHLQFINTGTPRSGSVVMNGWYGVIVRVSLDQGPITRINFGGANGIGGYIAGNIAQRWTDPTGQGHYTQTSPGPLTANNSFDSDFNFDTHFLGTPAMYTAASGQELSDNQFLTSRTGLVSDGFVGYGAALFVFYQTEPLFFQQGEQLRGVLDVNPAFQSSFIDAAYVVTDSAFQVDVTVTGTTGGGSGIGAVFEVPEPGTVSLTVLGALMGLAKRGRRRRRGERLIHMEPLEARMQLTVTAPTGVTATMGLNGSATVVWDNMGAGLSYSVERSIDGTTGWTAATVALLAPGTTHFTNPQIDASLAYYRVSATDGTATATSSGVQESVPTGVIAPKFEVDAETLSTNGVRLKWELNPAVASYIAIYRKATTDASWPGSPLATPGISAAVGYFDDTTIGAGGAYEYRLDYGSDRKFLYAGNAKPAQHSRGVALLVIDSSLVDGIGTSLQRDINGFASDLIGEGYQIVTRTVARADVPQDLLTDTSTWKGAVAATKAAIRGVWSTALATYGANLTNVILIGHVPVPYSGDKPADGHAETNGSHQGAWPTDMYYAVLSAGDDVWTDTIDRPNSYYPANSNSPGDGKFDQDSLLDSSRHRLQDSNGHEAKADVAIGRIDFARTGWGAPLDAGDQPSDTEVASLQTYFVKNHQFRTGQWSVKHQALVDREMDPTENFVNVNYFDPTRLASNVGGANVKNGMVSAFNDSSDWSNHDLNNDTWLWTYAAGSGARYATPPYYAMDYIRFQPDGYRGLYGNSYIFSNFGKHQSVFNMFYGSYIGDWDGLNSLLRMPLGEADGYGLTASWGASPTWDVHQMGLGGTIGESLLATENDLGTYTSEVSDGSVDVSLMGDPTLRQDAVASFIEVTAVSGSGGNVITWEPPESGIDGYYVYRATDPNGAWTRLNTSMTTSSTYTDTGATSVDGYYYMVRADKLTVTPSGSYHNLSVGAVSQPVVIDKAFNWQGHVPTTGNPWKQWIDVKFSQSVSVGSSQLAMSGQIWDAATSSLVAKTLVYNTDFKLIADPADRTTRIVFLDPATGGAGFAPNGVWTLTVSGTVANQFGRTLVNNQTLSFTFLIADANNDHSVDFLDLAIMSQNYNSTTPDPDQPRVWGDFNSDDSIDFLDLAILAQLYNISI